MATVQKWSGREARALREALRMGVRGFAAYLGVGERTVTKWEAAGTTRSPRPDVQAALDTALKGADDEARARFELALRSPTRAASAFPPPGTPSRAPKDTAPVQLVTSGGELAAALLDVVRGARECLVAVGSRSREPSYLSEVEDAVAKHPDMVHYRILIGPPHGHVFKDHLLRLLELRGPESQHTSRKSLYISVIEDLTHDYERFFVASERAAVVVLPSINSPSNFDTGLVVHDHQYLAGLLQHGKALYGRRRLETVESINELVALR